MLDVLWISHRQSEGHPLQSFSLFFPLYTESKDPFAPSGAKNCQSLARQKHCCTNASISHCKTRALSPGQCMTAERCAISQVYSSTVLVYYCPDTSDDGDRAALSATALRLESSPSGCRSRVENPVVASNVTPLSQASPTMACVRRIRNQLSSAKVPSMPMN